MTRHNQNLIVLVTTIICGILMSLPITANCSFSKLTAAGSPQNYENTPIFDSLLAAAPSRKKRQSGGGSTAVIGARITREATAGDWQDANFAVNNDAPTSRGKRDLSSSQQQNRNRGFQTNYGPPVQNSYGPPPPSSQPTFNGGYSSNGQNVQRQSSSGGRGGPSIDINLVLRLLLRLLERMQKFLTHTQELFSYINFDIVAARRYVSRNEIQVNSNLRINLVYDPNGVKCSQVCDGDTVGYGLIGLCTATYCNCDRQPGSRNHQDSFCMHNTVFDPVTLTCQHPGNTILCSDIQKPSTAYGVRTAGASAGAYGVPQK